MYDTTALCMRIFIKPQAPEGCRIVFEVVVVTLTQQV